MHKKISLLNANDASQQILQLKNNLFRLALNGVHSFGIFRAICISAGKLIGMIAREQIFTSVAGIVAGVFIGFMSSRIFVPFFQIAYDAYTQVPSFKVISYFSDRIKVLILVGVTLVSGLIILGIQISRIKISQAIKLGEE